MLDSLWLIYMLYSYSDQPAYIEKPDLILLQKKNNLNVNQNE
jgi:hypothetical protein